MKFFMMAVAVFAVSGVLSSVAIAKPTSFQMHASKEGAECYVTCAQAGHGLAGQLVGWSPRFAGPGRTCSCTYDSTHAVDPKTSSADMPGAASGKVIVAPTPGAAVAPVATPKH